MSHKLPETDPVRRCKECDHERPIEKFYAARRVCKSCLVRLQFQRRRGDKLSDISEYFDRWGRA